MIRIHFLTILMWLLGAVGVCAQDGFNPSSPIEPGPPPRKLSVAVEPAEGGSVSGAGRYVPGASVTLRAYNATGFVFAGWENGDGEILSTSSTFAYTKGEGDERLTARFTFSPGSPAEPEEIAQKLYYRLSVAATEGGSVSGGGRYQPGSSVRVHAYSEMGFDFVGWYNALGEQLATTASYDYTMTTNNTTLTARFRFNPSSPTEPDEPILRHSITVPTTDGGYTNFTFTRILTGSSTMLYAYANEGYRFEGWYLDGELYSTLKSFSYTMGDENVTFEPRFRFDPISPVEPSEATMKKFTFTIYSKTCRPGDTVKLPVMLTTTEELHDMAFQLTFPKDMRPSVDAVDVSAKAEGYTVSMTEITDPEALASVAVDETATPYILSFVGGILPKGNTVLLSFTLAVDETISTGTEYLVRINQVSLRLADASNMTAHTRNGRISVYKRGDANGDNNVSISDMIAIINYAKGQTVDGFIKEAANVNDDDNISEVDAEGVINIILNE